MQDAASQVVTMDNVGSFVRWFVRSLFVRFVPQLFMFLVNVSSLLHALLVHPFVGWFVRLLLAVGTP